MGAGALTGFGPFTNTGPGFVAPIPGFFALIGGAIPLNHANLKLAGALTSLGHTASKKPAMTVFFLLLSAAMSPLGLGLAASGFYEPMRPLIGVTGLAISVVTLSGLIAALIIPVVHNVRMLRKAREVGLGLRPRKAVPSMKLQYRIPRHL